MMLTKIIRADGKSIEEFADIIGVKPMMIYHAMRKNSCSDKLVEALSQHFGVDYSFLQRMDNRGGKCISYTSTRART